MSNYTILHNFLRVKYMDLKLISEGDQLEKKMSLVKH